MRTAAPDEGFAGTLWELVTRVVGPDPPQPAIKMAAKSATNAIAHVTRVGRSDEDIWGLWAEPGQCEIIPGDDVWARSKAGSAPGRSAGWGDRRFVLGGMI
jgi:hypothetical protein